MSDERQRGRVFGEVAAAYERARPNYPPTAVKALAERGARGTVLDVGAGTGKLTRLLAPLAARVVAVEPDAEMAAIARAHLGHHRHVDIDVRAFEAFEAPDGSFDLLTVGQAWHWLDPDTRAQRAARLLRPGGWLALLWNNPAIDDASLQAEIDAAYQRHAPELRGESKGTPIQTAERTAQEEIRQSPLLSESETLHLPWTHRYTTAEHADLLATMSAYRLLEPATRQALIGDISAAIDARGGVLHQAYTCHIVTARRSRDG